MQVDLSKLTIEQLSSLGAQVFAELASRATGKTIAKVDHPAVNATATPNAKPSNRSPEHMAAMRAAKNAKQAKATPNPAANVPTSQPQRKFAVRKPDGTVTRKTFETEAEASAWLSSWVNNHAASKYSVVGIS
jgi:hypothetical protein